MARRPKSSYDAETRSDPDFPWLELGEFFRFPDPEDACGTVVAVGGNLSPGMLVSAYAQGIFPWFNDDDPLYWQSPDPRFVIVPGNFRVPSRLSRDLKKKPFEIRLDTSFERVISYCSLVARDGQDGTWITDDMLEAYVSLHREGIAHSVEAWRDGDLVGGFYGISLGGVFFGESMFTRVSDAAKVAFATFAPYFFSVMGGRLIDSQVYTDHIARFGGTNVSRDAYLRMLDRALAGNPVDENDSCGDTSCECGVEGRFDSVSRSLATSRGLWRADTLSLASLPANGLKAKSRLDR